MRGLTQQPRARARLPSRASARGCPARAAAGGHGGDRGARTPPSPARPTVSASASTPPRRPSRRTSRRSGRRRESAATCSATEIDSRVLPAPPGPVRVTSRRPPVISRSRDSRESSIAPDERSGYRGQVTRGAEAAQRGKRRAASRGRRAGIERCGSTMSFSRCTPRSSREVPDGSRPATSSTVVSAQHHLTAVGRRGHPRSQVHVEPDQVVLKRFRVAGVQPHAHSQRNPVGPRVGLEACCPSAAAATASAAELNTTKKLSPSVPTSRPPACSNASRRMPPVRRRARRRTPARAG